MKRIIVLSLVLAVITALYVSLSRADTGVKAFAYDVHDGDTMKVVIEVEEGRANLLTLRLEGIDAPESAQDFGKEAQQYAAIWAFGHPLTLTVGDTDRYGRKVANVCRGSSSPYKCLSYQLVRNGLAWHYTAYSDDERLARAQDKARQEGRGLWSNTNPEPPWEWRKRRRQ